MYDPLIHNISNLVPLTKEDVILIKAAFRSVKLKKKEFLLRAGEPSNHMRFIAKGCIKLYNIDETGKEHILQFGIKVWWVNDLYAYLTQKPAKFFIQAITDSIILQIYRDQLNTLFDQVHMMDRFFRIKTQNGYVALQERTINTMSQTAEERYTEFIQRYRVMEQQIPQYMIASYLGITPEHLSVLRKNLARKLS
ncbi:cyclic nucleotide-binding domain-containing protein [Muricauda sp. JGD-17]|uniref:Cyclic nucleotide-binding domain-containing protein n=1 Tax=Flagellimonas ochracea TaxID=2696472 RepID=A0A964WXT7_9FLAO|nr:Crp/Fnr family transcriptional regulator [Allomuricauda ochracea]NAY91929.1 cyclic nucleotide-binding domain-containing protein [Allomuricauda ochracea]